VPPRIVKSQSEHIAYAGVPFALDCAASGDPVPDIKWLDDGVIHSYSSELYIAKVVKDDEGNYSISISPEALSVVVGRAEQFRCISAGAVIEWLFDGKLVVPDNITINITYETRGFIQFNTLSYRVISKDLGGVHYVTCKAKSCGFNKSSSSYVIVEVRGEIRKWEFQHSLQVIRGDSKSNSLPCPAYGYPPVDRVWYKGARVVDVNQTRFSVSGNGSLVIGQVDVADEGVYSCHVTNTIGNKGYTDSVTINVTIISINACL
jgi:hypothetical protein